MRDANLVFDQASARTSTAEMSLCELQRRAKDLVGTPVRIEATYHTDRTRYEYFRDEACGVGGMLGVSYTTATGDESVRAFQDRLNAHCKRRGMNYCADSVPMTAEVAIVQEPGGSTSGSHATGEFTVDIRRIIVYRIEDKTGT